LGWQKVATPTSSPIQVPMPNRRFLPLRSAVEAASTLFGFYRIFRPLGGRPSIMLFPPTPCLRQIPRFAASVSCPFFYRFAPKSRVAQAVDQSSSRFFTALPYTMRSPSTNAGYLGRPYGKLDRVYQIGVVRLFETDLAILVPTPFSFPFLGKGRVKVFF